MKNKFYITTAILYTNSPPHIGFALELLEADVIARYHRLVGDDTHFLTGTDEHGATVVRGAAKYGKPVDIFVNEMAKLVQKLTKSLNISNNDFIRTSDQVRHWPSAAKLWKRIKESGSLYEKEYEGLYCIGHEAFIKKSDLKNGTCPLHKTKPEKIKEKNWFFRFTKYKKEIKEKIKLNQIKIIPEIRKQEVLNLFDDAEDISFSRPSKDLKWGIPVPDDPTQTQYVWTDALTNYISALGYANDSDEFKKYWPADIHLIGKDILRFHAMIWPAMLLSAGLELPKAIYVHGFITVEGEKMSKTIGNVIDPFALVEKYGVDPVRYFLLREIPSTEDGDFSHKKLEERYNGDLANGLGNLIQRVAVLVDSKLNGELIYDESLVEREVKSKAAEVGESVKQKIELFELHKALSVLWSLIIYSNQYIDDKKPWAAFKRDAAEGLFRKQGEASGPYPEGREKEFLVVMTNLLYLVHSIAGLLQPFLPETSQKIAEIFGDDLAVKQNLDKHHFHIKKAEPLFPRFTNS